ncbi:MAG: hypothetical protein JWO60_2897, partial [Frankiales bacterium]|nr:hypothetical protein [Frankiales bacterium]
MNRLVAGAALLGTVGLAAAATPVAAVAPRSDARVVVQSTGDTADAVRAVTA